jgi:hypothetical protein
MMLEMVQVRRATAPEWFERLLYCYVESHYHFSWIVSFQNGDIIYASSAWEDGRQEDEEEDVGGC